MTLLTVTARGQVTLRKEVLRRLGVRPGEKIAADLLPDGRIEMRSAGVARIEELFGSLAAPADENLTIDDMNEVVGAGWTGRR